MRRILAMVGLVAALAIPAAAFGVSLHAPHVGQGCVAGGTFHFVALDATNATVLTVDFSGGGDFSGTPDKVTPGGTAHWTIDGIGTVNSATAVVASKLVLSDFSCDEKKDPDPKK